MTKSVNSKRSVASLLLATVIAGGTGFIAPKMAYAGCYGWIRDVHNVTASPSLNVRSGPGTSYPVIALQNTGTDVIRETTGNVTANGYQWMQSYYWQSGVTGYGGSYTGWVVWTYLSDAGVAYTGTSRPIYQYDNLTSSLRNATAGTSAGTKCTGIMQASPSNVNAWYVFDTYDLPYVTGYVDGYVWDGR